jgi:hypothetical protein
LSASFAFQTKDKAIVGPDFDVLILNEPLRPHHSFAVIPANQFFELDTPAVFRDLA